MIPAFEQLHGILKRLPGLGYKSAERIALYLLVEKPDVLPGFVDALNAAASGIVRCRQCGNIADQEMCQICANPKRDKKQVCIVEHIPDLMALEKSAAYTGTYHVLYGKLSPIHGIGPEELNFASLSERLQGVEEVILALSNDIEGEATCHYIRETVIGPRDIRITRIGFGLPSGGNLVYADSGTLKSALDGRRDFS